MFEHTETTTETCGCTRATFVVTDKPTIISRCTTHAQKHRNMIAAYVNTVLNKTKGN